MINNRDEILIKLAALLDEIAIPPVPQSIQIESPKAPETAAKLLKPIEIVNTPKQEPNYGTAEWAAKYHTQEFLKGVKHPYRGFVRDPANKDLVVETMHTLVKTHPADYFAWDLNRRQELQPWLYPAAVTLIKTDPVMALMKEIYRFPELKDLQTELWKAVLDKEISRSAFDPSSSGALFVNTIFNKMRHLAGQIAVSDPEFYRLYIEGKSITTKQFDDEAKRTLKQKEELGKIKPIKLRYKTKL